MISRVLTVLLACVSLFGCNRTPPELAKHNTHNHAVRVVKGTGKRGSPALYIDKRTPAELAQAACTPGRCRGDQIRTPLAAASSSPIIPPSWTIPNWYIDPANSTVCASDTNSGTSATCSGGCSGSVCPSGIGPIATFQELNVHRWGCLGNPSLCPRLRQTTNLTFLSSQSGNTDPVPLSPSIEDGANVGVEAPLQQIATGILASVTQKNRATPQLLTANLGASAAAGLLFYDVPQNAYAWVYKNVSGNVWSLSQPLAAAAFPYPSNSFPAEVNLTSANDGDAFVLYRPVSVDLVSATTTLTDYNGGYDNALQLYHVIVYDPAGAGNDNFQRGLHTWMIESASQRTILRTSSASDIYEQSINDYFDGGWNGGNGPGSVVDSIVGGVMVGVDPYIFNELTAIDGDAILGVGGQLAQGGLLGLVYIESGESLVLAGVQTRLLAFGYSPSVNAQALWGPGGLSQAFTSCFYYDPNYTAEQQILFTGTWTMNGGTTANSMSISAGVGTIHTGITINALNLDTTAGATGFGGRAFISGGASVVASED